MDRYKLINGDCVSVLGAVPDKSVDLIITDPPYNISKQNNFKTMGRSGINFGEWDKGFDITSWLQIACDKVRNGGGIVIFNSWENIGDIAKELRKHDCEPKDVIRLIKKNPMPRNRDRRFIVDYEFAVWAVKNGDKWTFNRIDEKFERPEILCSVTPKSEKAFGNHPTQKPLYSMEWLINRLSNENDIILDCFMGSGTTGVACLNTNRRFVGIELDKAYFQIAQDRIKNHEKSILEVA